MNSNLYNTCQDSNPSEAELDELQWNAIDNSDSADGDSDSVVGKRKIIFDTDMDVDDMHAIMYRLLHLLVEN